MSYNVFQISFKFGKLLRNSDDQNLIVFLKDQLSIKFRSKFDRKTTKQQTIDALKKSRKISEFIVKKNTGRVFIASIDELIKDILEVIKKEVNVKLEQMAAVKKLEKSLKANRYIHKVDNVLPDLESNERTLGFFESLGVYRFKE
ncbi:hypothetical protein PHYBLDRAFT_167583 [Phycomyces blakesleeanus NRRL 1555(-)]|uniref:Uncharacterized protein n=1 Tax=Phycomyces blakesleeanus (strain ATCC 8743b / DSM 1359 / FGSC 10004 / NBRC 33097 / NRRL 1555) TaxID=763407 RepID=A0A162PUM0_PHYB8|nr:hypothetical protein PHYBLDRAFT_167583 [Phycomyces blakesleeanus NRRL 1555(-)]OAD74156.1 hypothetical protein PHYBLDRAFT_167583 [Phycomyces blakesleeanus NRRL 1555(-)]|eukprot:XP_018292196.1 hypothetical protein PHYBLDRAFT_167583 [Phycomyces blakesleeanus NRRL 1555(-)]